MIRNLARLAYHLDEWLQRTLGRPYNAFLAVGIVLGLVHQISDLPKDVFEHGGFGGLFVAVLDVALLINQAGQFHQHMERRRAMPRRRGALRRDEEPAAAAKTERPAVEQKPEA